MLVLKVEELSKSYKGRRVVSRVDLKLNEGEVIGLLGPNGAGKTTTFYIIVGLTTPDTGRVLLDGKEITQLPMYLRARSGISYLPQEPSVFRKLTVEENLMVIAETLNLNSWVRSRLVKDLLEEFGIAHLNKNRAYTLSGGERRRLEIARSLVISPSFILLDEPFAGIDPLAVLDIQNIIARLKTRKIGVLITDHNVRETLRITDRAYIINNGEIFRTGTPHELASDPEVKKVYLGESFMLN
ncbi:MAG: LPS export ABC transporter ATP-binding protein [Acidobacteria bacterium]|nr:LPS export ABC transporter ATP-binding protein [Acidobacteriota bacterium]MBI3656582.1 LPS export ABC transporter ATP-binding protein [Acidobacteriota bacterium]